MFTTTDDGTVMEYVRTYDGRWFLWRDTGPNVDSPGWVGAFTAPDDTVQGTETEYYVYHDAAAHVIVGDLTAPFQA
jgi:hypothetical protein